MNRNKKYLEFALLSCIDVLSITLVLGIAFLIRKVGLPAVAPNPWHHTTVEHLRNSTWMILVWMLFLYYDGLYTRRFSFWDEVKMLWRVSFSSTVGAFVVVSMGQLSHLVPRTLIVLTGIISLPFLPLARIQTRRLLTRYGLFKRRVVIIGAGELGKLCLRALRREPNFGYEVAGIIDDDPAVGRVIDGVKVHRGIGRTERYISSGRISDVFIAIPEIEKNQVQDLINRMQFKVERILLVPDLQSVPMIGTEIHHYFHDQIFSIEIKNNLEKTYNFFIKRVFDSVMSLVMLAALCIPMALISLAIMMALAGPAIAEKLNAAFAAIQDAQIFVVAPPPVRGIGTGGDFKMMVEDRAGQGLARLEAATWQLALTAAGSGQVARAFTTFSNSSPQYFLDIDRTRAEMLRVPVENVFETLQVYLGSVYVNDFTLFGRNYRVTAQADAPFRTSPDDIARLRARKQKLPFGVALRFPRIHGAPDRVRRLRDSGFPRKLSSRRVEGRALTAQ